MKSLNILLLSIFFSVNLYAKKVKFVVDMSDTTVSSTGVYILGDFQQVSGVSPLDWAAGICKMDSIGNGLYAYYTNIPAFRKYEFLISNGDGYDYETVPLESRVDYLGGNNSNENRWYYVDSVADDTTIIGGFLLGKNAPKNKHLFRVQLTLPSAATGTALPHLLGSFNSWSATANTMYSLDTNNVYDVYTYIDPNTTVDYLFANENSVTETMTGKSCANTSGYRFFNSTKDSVLDAVCYNLCYNCYPLSINYGSIVPSKIYPNPTQNYISVSNNNNTNTIKIIDVMGNIVLQKHVNHSEKIDVSTLTKGIYTLELNEFEKIKIIKD